MHTFTLTDAQLAQLKELYQVCIDHSKGAELSNDCKQLARHVVTQLDKLFDCDAHY